jgi:RNA polymerase sigma-70 factor (ECF subfamily)
MAAPSPRARPEETLEGSLVARAAAGDSRAFEQLVDRHLPALYRLAAAMVGPEDARDVTQETLVSAWRELPGLRNGERFESWLRSILMNRARNLLRTRRRHPQVALAHTGHEATAFVEEPINALDRQLAIDDALATLGPDHRAIIVLHYLADLPIREVAEILGLREGTTKSRLHAGLSRLRAQFSEGPA